MLKLRLFVPLFAAYLVCALAASPAHAVDSEPGQPLPEPLGLDDIFYRLDTGDHPDLLLSRARQQATRAEAARIDAAYDIEAEINLQANWIDPSSLAVDQSTTDHQASLNVSKRLYDFGVTGRQDRAYASLVAASEIDTDYALGLHRIEIARLFFDVLLADLEYGWANETMAMDYVTLDKLRDRFELDQVDEIELLEEEARYLESLATRTDASLRQRVSRARLAEALNLPGQLPSDLLPPPLDGLHDAPAEPESMIASVLASAPQLAAQHNRVQAALLQHEADTRRWQPSLSAELEVTEYTRDLPSRENWRAGIELKIPLHQTGLNKAEAAASWSSLLTQRARLQQLQSQVREDVFLAWQNITTLVSRSKALETKVRYADRALDKSRGEYELELRTDFGDAMVRVSRARLDKATTDYQLTIARMQLALMMGQDPADVMFERRGKQNE